ncbi:MAG: hypothetical protein JST09_14610 [Bacteroidetes bacterium]|nr:hypothetical protein [Bacteroidota bacterium]
MEENQNSSLFGLGIDTAAKAHLSEAARWARFLSIVGFVVIGLIVIVGIFFGSLIGAMTSGLSRNGMNGMPAGAGGMLGSFVVVIYILIAAVYFFPCLFLFHFANKMKTALAANDQELLNTSFQNLKKLFRFMGILTIICLALFAIQLLIGLLAVGSMR